MLAPYISVKKISKFILLIVMLSLIFDIGGVFGLKSLALLLVFVVVGIKVSLNTSVPKAFLIEYCFFTLFFLILVVSIFNGNDFFYGVSEIGFFLYFSLLLAANSAGYKYYSDLFINISLLAAIIVILTFISIYSFPSVGFLWAEFASNNKLGYIGVNSLYGGAPNVYYRWSVWLVLGFSLALFRSSKKSSLLIFIAGILTLSTAIIFGLIFVLVFYYVFYRSKSSSFIYRYVSFIVVFLALVFLFFNFEDYSTEVLTKFSSSSDSTGSKLGHIHSVISIMYENPSFLIFGQGPGTEFYSTGVNMKVRNIEVSHFNLLRQFGVIGSIGFYLYFLYILRSMIKMGQIGYAWIIGLVAIFLIAGTNPLLLSPIFFVPLILARLSSIEYVDRI